MEFGINYKLFDPLPSCHFHVMIQAIHMGFTKISNIEYTVETEMVAEGGVNSYAHALLKPNTTERTIIFERGVMMRPFADLLTDRFSVGSRLNSEVFIFVLDRNKVPYKLYILGGCFVKKWSSSDLDGLSSQLLIERFEMSYESLEVLDYATIIKRLAMGALLF